jgi:hypothetical protein
VRGTGRGEGISTDELATEVGASPEPTPAKQFSWAIYRLKGTPAKLLGHVEAPSEESAIKRAIEEFNVPPELQKRLLARRGA